MKLDIKKAYQYYVDNITRSCDNRILSEQDFHEAFAMWLQELEIMNVMQHNLNNIPVYNEKCKTSRIVNINVVIKKCM